MCSYTGLHHLAQLLFSHESGFFYQVLEFNLTAELVVYLTLLIVCWHPTLLLLIWFRIFCIFWCDYFILPNWNIPILYFCFHQLIVLFYRRFLQSGNQGCCVFVTIGNRNAGGEGLVHLYLSNLSKVESFYYLSFIQIKIYYKLSIYLFK
mgnify:CR=1 FL=1